MPISANDLNNLKEFIEKYQAQLVAVSKTKSVEEIKSIYDMGHLDFGENRVYELREKQPLLPEDIRWHAIGNLQRKKVKYIAPYIYMIHSVDSVALLQEIEKRAAANERTISILFEIKIASEASKHGFDFEELNKALAQMNFDNFSHVEFAGVMGMATFTDDQNQIKEEFSALKQYFDLLKSKYFDNNTFKEISMGMSGDYELALKEGATIVRIGSKIFGARN